MILHLSTQQTGGAAIAAMRIHQALMQSGMESCFLSGSGMADAEQNIEVVPKIYERYWQRGLYKLGIPITEYRKWQRTRDQRNLPDTVLSGIRTDYRLSRHPLIQKAEVIHLHWVTGMFDWRDFFSNVSQPIVWTMHDMNPFMGIFHYQGDLERGGLDSQAYEKEIKQQKVKIIQGRTDLTCIAPSHWLSKKARSSEVLQHCNHRVIRYTIDTQVFQPFPRELGRDVFGLPKDKKILLVVAERLDDYRKGMDLFLEGLTKCGLEQEWEVVAVGKGVVEKADLKVHSVGSISDFRLMALLYSSADLFVIPSREDNFPNTILESLCCGTPVVGLPAGGIPEAIVSPRDGLVATDISSTALSEVLISASRMNFDRKAIRDNAVTRFANKTIAKQYQELYQDLVTFNG